MLELFWTIQGIDKDHNGYVTQTELDDILKIIVPELKDVNLKSVYLPFTSSANKVLVDYKKFKGFLIAPREKKLLKTPEPVKSIVQQNPFLDDRRSRQSKIDKTYQTVQTNITNESIESHLKDRLRYGSSLKTKNRFFRNNKINVTQDCVYEE